MISTHKVVADTNFLLSPFQFRFNLEMELRRLLGSYEIIIPKSVLNELKVISSKKGPIAIAARNVLDIVFQGVFKIVSGESRNADDEVLELAKKFNAIVATNDKELKQKAIKNGLPCIFLKEERYLYLQDPSGRVSP